MNKHRIITAYTLNNPNVIRLEPPLNVSRAQIDIVLQALDDIFAAHKGFFSAVAAGAKTMIKSFIKK
jgi:putrescine aminotransferase